MEQDEEYVRTCFKYICICNQTNVESTYIINQCYKTSRDVIWIFKGSMYELFDAHESMSTTKTAKYKNMRVMREWNQDQEVSIINLCIFTDNELYS